MLTQAINSGNPQQTGWTSLAQKTMDYMISDGPGRADFVRYWRLLARPANTPAPRSLQRALLNALF